MTRILDRPHLELAVAEAAGALAAVADRDWSATAHGLDWSCRATLEHVCDCHVGYALLVTGRRTEGYAPVELVLDREAASADLPDTLRATGLLLSAALATMPAGLRVKHPYGMADADAVTGMGIIETLVHTWDVARALGGGFIPSRDLCAVTLTRMFPDVAAGPGTGADPWEALLWATGRAELTGHPRRSQWRWTNDPAMVS